MAKVAAREQAALAEIDREAPDAQRAFATRLQRVVEPPREVGLDRLERIDDSGEKRIRVVPLGAGVHDLAHERPPASLGREHDLRLQREHGIAAAESCSILGGEALVAGPIGAAQHERRRRFGCAGRGPLRRSRRTCR
jgi:hypothetical protein